MDPLMQSLQNGIEDRQKELTNLVSILAKNAYTLQYRSNVIRIATIILSAITTAKGVIDKIYGADSAGPLIIFTIIGIVTTAAIGIEAAFKFEKRGADLNMLSASSQATVIAVDSEWRKNIGSIADSDLRKAARDLLTLQDTKLAEIHQKAASSGVNITLAVRALEDPNDRPYAA